MSKLIRLQENTKFLNDMNMEADIPVRYSVAYETPDEDIADDDLFPDRIVIGYDLYSEQWRLEGDDVLITTKYPSTMHKIAGKLGYTF